MWVFALLAVGYWGTVGAFVVSRRQPPACSGSEEAGVLRPPMQGFVPRLRGGGHMLPAEPAWAPYQPGPRKLGLAHGRPRMVLTGAAGRSVDGSLPGR